jgi:hypothetical protein
MDMNMNTKTTASKRVASKTIQQVMSPLDRLTLRPKTDGPPA